MKKTVIVTGSGRGIGKAIALDCGREGYNVIVVSRTSNEVQAVSSQINKMGGRSIALTLDLTNDRDIEVLVKETMKHFKTVDVLINNAGYAGSVRSFTEETVEEFDKTMNINLRGAFLLTRKCVAIMMAKRNGYIINISSTVALSPSSTLTAYSASKAGLTAMSQSIFESVKNYGIRVSTVYPGITDTEMVRDLKLPSTPSSMLKAQDVSDCVMFLLKTNKNMIIKDIVPRSFGKIGA